MSPPASDAGAFSHPYHLPVLTGEVVGGLEVSPGGVYLDGTLGEGGHSLAILEAASGSFGQQATGRRAGGESDLNASAGGMVIGVDLDGRSVAIAAGRLSGFGARFLPLQGNYAEMIALAAEVDASRSPIDLSA